MGLNYNQSDLGHGKVPRISFILDASYDFINLEVILGTLIKVYRVHFGYV